MANDISKALSAYQAAVSRQVIPSAEKVQPETPAGSFASMVKSAGNHEYESH